MEFVYTPWKGRLMADLQSAQKELILVSPYITKVIANEIFSSVAGRGVVVKTISRFDKTEFQMGSSDLDAHYALSGIGYGGDGSFELRKLASVHAKIFIIDSRIAYVGSSNLTFSGLLRNYEGCVRVTDPVKILSLRAEMINRWERCKTMDRAEFLAMLQHLERSSHRGASSTAEHFYDVNAPLDEASIVSSGEALHTILKETQGTPAVVVSTLAPPSTADLVLEGLGQAERSAVAAEELIDVSARWLPMHARIVKRFLALLEGRFGLNVVDHGVAYAQILKTKAVNGWSPRTDHGLDFGVDSAALYAPSDEVINQSGAQVLDLCAAHVALRSGILTAYGVEIASDFRTKATTPAVAEAAWTHNFLGPLLWAHESESTNTRVVASRTRDALGRLMAAVALHEGMAKALEIYEEFFNPADVLGTDILSLVDLEAHKSVLQNIAQKEGWTKAVYAKPVSEGPEANLTWRSSVTLRGITVGAEGASLSLAENAAAAGMIERMAMDPKLSRFLKAYREERLQKAYKEHQPMFPRVELSVNVLTAMMQAYEAMGSRVKPSLGYVALVDNETRKDLRLRASNPIMSWFGSHLFNVADAWVRIPLRKLGLTNTRAQIARKWDVDGIRGAAGLPRAQEAFLVPIVNAMASAIFLSHSFERLFETLRHRLEGIHLEAPTSERALHLQGHEAVQKMVQTFAAGVPYSTILQEIVQSKGTALPVSAVTDVQSLPHGRLDAVGVRTTWGSHVTVARGKNKVEARNQAAFQMIKALAADNAFWIDKMDD